MRTTIAGAALFLGASLGVSAGAFAGDNNYAVVLGDYLVHADDTHKPQLKDSIGFDARYGNDADKTWAYEIGYYYDRMQAKRGGHGMHSGVGLDVLYKFGEFGRFTPFVIGGANANYADLITGAKNEPRGGLALDAGGGVLAGIGNLFDRPASVRVQAKAAYEMFNDDSYLDVRFYAGLQLALSKPPEPAPEVTVVPAVEPTPEPAPVVEAPPAPAPEPVVEPAAPPAEPTIETAKEGDKIVLHGVNFEFGKDRLTMNAMTILSGVAEQLAKRPELTVEVGGHTDGKGSAKFNQKLSERRAKSVVAFLVNRGIEASRLTAVGYGMAQPVDTNETDEGRERNRRVELKITGMSSAPAPATAETPPAPEAPAPAEAPAASETPPPAETPAPAEAPPQN